VTCSVNIFLRQQSHILTAVIFAGGCCAGKVQGLLHVGGGGGGRLSQVLAVRGIFQSVTVLQYYTDILNVISLLYSLCL
jgi:hypothetical protein